MNSRFRDYLAVTTGLLLLWQLVATWIADPMLPGPVDVMRSIRTEYQSGALMHPRLARGAARDNLRTG